MSKSETMIDSDQSSFNRPESESDKGFEVSISVRETSRKGNEQTARSMKNVINRIIQHRFFFFKN